MSEARSSKPNVVPLETLSRKSPMVMLYNFAQVLREDTFIVEYFFHGPSSLLCVVTRSVKGHSKLALEVNKTGYIGEPILMGKRIRGSGTRTHKPSTERRANNNTKI